MSLFVDLSLNNNNVENWSPLVNIERLIQLNCLVWQSECNILKLVVVYVRLGGSVMGRQREGKQAPKVYNNYVIIPECLPAASFICIIVCCVSFTVFVFLGWKFWRFPFKCAYYSWYERHRRRRRRRRRSFISQYTIACPTKCQAQVEGQSRIICFEEMHKTFKGETWMITGVQSTFLWSPKKISLEFKADLCEVKKINIPTIKLVFYCCFLFKLIYLDSPEMYCLNVLFRPTSTRLVCTRLCYFIMQILLH